MKKLVVLALALLVSTNVYAFGGGGHGHSSSYYRKVRGVDAIGTHVDPDNPIIPPDFRECNDDETAVIGKCCPNDLVYTENNETKCCDAGNMRLVDGACVEAGPS